MHITQLYTYPIKSLRSVPLTTAVASPHGLPYDRRFMLIKIHGDTPIKPRSKSHFYNDMENMTVTYYPELVLFLQSIDESAGTLLVTHDPPNRESWSLNIPLEPDIAGLKKISVKLHGSPADAYKMGEGVNSWFSSCLGYEVMLAYLGPHRRPVLGNLLPNATEKPAKPSTSWLSSIAASLPSLMVTQTEERGITFADLAAYLVVTEESLHDVSSRLSDGVEMDVTKFRPNIVVSGSAGAWVEDYWGGITITNNKTEVTEKQDTEIVLTNNCGRCVSINIDYSTGKPATGEQGTVLKKLMKDRRVDKGNTYSPVFGRYGFLKSGTAEQTIAVGNEVTFSKINAEHTTIEWPGM